MKLHDLKRCWSEKKCGCVWWRVAGKLKPTDGVTLTRKSLIVLALRVMYPFVCRRLGCWFYWFSLGAVQFDYAPSFICWSGLRKTKICDSHSDRPKHSHQQHTCEQIIEWFWQGAGYALWCDLVWDIPATLELDFLDKKQDFFFLI